MLAAVLKDMHLYRMCSRPQVRRSLATGRPGCRQERQARSAMGLQPVQRPSLRHLAGGRARQEALPASCLALHLCGARATPEHERRVDLQPLRARRAAAAREPVQSLDVPGALGRSRRPTVAGRRGQHSLCAWAGQRLQALVLPPRGGCAAACARAAAAWCCRAGGVCRRGSSSKQRPFFQTR